MSLIYNSCWDFSNFNFKLLVYKIKSLYDFESKIFNCKKQNINKSRTIGLVISITFFWFKISASDLKIVIEALLLLF